MKTIEERLSKIRSGHTIVQSLGLSSVRADNLAAEAGIDHGFLARMGGVSPAPYDELNFSFTRPDDPANVSRNYRIFSSAFGIDEASLVAVNHEHAANVVRVDRENCGQGISREPLPFCDGIITDDPLVTLVTLHADCSCVYLYDRAHRAIGLAHSGWKGTFRRVGQRLAERMRKEFNTDPASLIAAVGPNICFDCFEVDSGIGDDFEREFGYPRIQKPGRKGKAYVDIKAAIGIQLLDAGIPEQNIYFMDLCTFERKDLFFSHRRDKGLNGAMIGFLRLK